MRMKSAEEPLSKESDPKPDRSPVTEARRVIEEYADDLREIIKKLRQLVD